MFGGLLKLSARNVFPGKVVDITRGQTTAHVKIEVGPGMVITSAITVESVNDLGLAVGDRAYAIIKSSEVIVGVD